MRNTKFRFPVTTLAGSTLRNIFMLGRGHRIEPKYRLKFIFSACIAGIFEGFNVAERLIWQKRVRQYRTEKSPVFIIGFWRSGTTLLHNLMCQDPDAAYTTTFHAVFPNLLLTQSWWLKPLVNKFLPANRPFDNVDMDMDFPQEEEFGMMNVQSSTIYKFFIFPADFDRILAEELFTAEMPAGRLEEWKRHYAGMLAKAKFNTGGTRFIGKNPCNLTRIGLLLEMYPDAKFIFIHRHPCMVIESLYRFILSIFPGVQLQDTPAGFSREKVVLLYEKIIRTYFRDRERIKPDNLVEISMDEFITDKTGTLEKIYSAFGMTDFSSVLPAMERFLEVNPNSHHEPYDPQPETVSLVAKHLSDIARELGYHDN